MTATFPATSAHKPLVRLRAVALFHPVSATAVRRQILTTVLIFFAGESRDVETVSPASRRGASGGGITLFATQVYHRTDFVLLQVSLHDPPVCDSRQLRLPAVLFAVASFSAPTSCFSRSPSTI